MSAEHKLPDRPDRDNRTRPDRRQQPTSPWGAFSLAGRRMRNRRAEEHKLPYFVDRYSSTMLVIILMLIVASLADAALTLRLMEAGGDEINPVMGRLLDCGRLPFLLGKYVLTVVGMPLLLIFKNHYLFSSWFRVGYLLPVFVALYAILISYQVVLICRI